MNAKEMWAILCDANNIKVLKSYALDTFNMMLKSKANITYFMKALKQFLIIYARMHTQ